MSNLGGKRPGAGRKPGGRNLRTIAATELLREAQERFPDYNPLSALIALAKDAEKAGDVETARQCHAAVLPYTAPRFRPVECDPEAALAYEERLADIRGRYTAAALKAASPMFGLADRLERMIAAKRDEEGRAASARPVAPAVPAAITPPEIEAEPAEPEAPAGSVYTPEITPDPTPIANAEIIGAAPQPYQPILAPWPQRQAFLDECGPDTFLSNYD